MKNRSKKKFQLYKRLKVTTVISALLFYSFAPSALLPGMNMVQAEESGTESEPIQIDSVQELKEIANGLDKHYILTSDIELDVDTFWKPIGTSQAPFTGTLDGNGFKISNLTIFSPLDYCGLFAFISNAKINNLTLEDVNIQGQNYTAGLAGNATGLSEIENCHVSGFIKGLGFVGGLIGSYSGTGSIKRVEISGEINASANYAGGLIGYCSGIGIESSVMFGEVKSSSIYVAGLIGRLDNGYILNSDNKANITSISNGIGGIVGITYTGACKIANCNNSGSVNGANYVGGVVGYQYYANLELLAVYNTGKVVGSGIQVGGIVGRSETQFSLKKSANFGDIGGGTSVGGILGHQYANGVEISTVYNMGKVVGSADFIGGIVGSADSQLSLKESANLGDVNGNNYVGGMVGHSIANGKIEILNGYNQGNIIAAGDYIGGVIGHMNSQVGGQVLNCYSTGNVSASDYAGGLVGYVYQGSIYNSFAANENIIAANSGGYRIAGLLKSSVISGNTAFDDMVVTVKGAVRDIKSSNPAHNSQDGMNISKELLIKNSSYLEATGWDFDTIWQVAKDGIDFPVLRNLDLTPPEQNIRVEGVSLDKKARTIQLGETAALKATITPVNASNQALTWSSSNAEVAEVAANGVVTTKAVGNATISVKTTDGNYIANCDITVVSASGEEDDPIQISTIQDLKAMANGLDKHYVLTQDIDLGAAADWQPVGRSTAHFTGSLDGKGYTIKNLSNDSQTDYFALFGYATDAKISNLKLTEVAVTGKGHLAAIVSVAAGATEISDCSVSGIVNGTGNYVGGLVSYMTNESKLVNTQMAGKVQGLNYIGGLVGRLNGGEISQSQSTAEVIAAGSYYGELAGIVDQNGRIVEYVEPDEAE